MPAASPRCVIWSLAFRKKIGAGKSQYDELRLLGSVICAIVAGATRYVRCARDSTSPVQRSESCAASPPGRAAPRANRRRPSIAVFAASPKGHIATGTTHRISATLSHNWAPYLVATPRWIVRRRVTPTATVRTTSPMRSIYLSISLEVERLRTYPFRSAVWTRILTVASRADGLAANEG